VFYAGKGICLPTKTSPKIIKFVRRATPYQSDNNMLNRLLQKLTASNLNQNNFNGLLNEVTVPSKSILINEGEIIRHLYFVKKGCLRLWFNNQGNDVTYQFFFENQVVSGFVDEEKSMFTLESIEASTIVIIKKNDFENLLNEIPELKDEFLKYIMTRLAFYSKLFLSRIKDSPAKRYELLLKDNPEILRRVPQHYIATFLGITPVSLSRIRNRKR
jgi:CRP-like cAMP-binding protein